MPVVVRLLWSADLELVDDGDWVVGRPAYGCGVHLRAGPWSALPAQPERTQPISGGDRRRQVQSVRTSPKASREAVQLTDAGRRS